MSHPPPYPARRKEETMNPDPIVFWATTALSLAAMLFA
ncbi:MAG: hypothetical protein EFKGCFLK_01491 [Rhodocyclaceae bacterium]|nr:hypothetical protein [Rhodocyclaceae bacterium]CAG0934650.1 hypothetical protein RHDC3_02983 [Rhodocyclaceae bacterium]